MGCTKERFCNTPAPDGLSRGSAVRNGIAGWIRSAIPLCLDGNYTKIPTNPMPRPARKKSLAVVEVLHSQQFIDKAPAALSAGLNARGDGGRGRASTAGCSRRRFFREASSEPTRIKPGLEKFALREFHPTHHLMCKRNWIALPSLVALYVPNEVGLKILVCSCVQLTRLNAL